MAVLDRQTIRVPLGGGIETELADKLVPLGKMLELQNSIITQTGRVTKRPGNVALAALGATNYWQLATRAGALVSLQTAGALPIAAYGAGAGRWAVPGNGINTDLRGPITTQRIPAFSGTAASVESPDVGYMASVNCYIAAFDGTGARIQIQDAGTGQAIYTQAIPAGVRPRVLVVADTAIVAYAAGGQIGIEVLTAANIRAGTIGFNGPLGGVAPHATDPYIDMIATNATTVRIAYRTNVSTTQMITVTLPGLGTSTVAITDSAGAAINPAHCLAWVQDPSAAGRLGLATIDNSNVKVHWDISGAGLPATTFTMSALSTFATNVCAHTISNAASGEFIVLWGQGNGGGNVPKTLIAKRTVAGGIVSGDFIRSVGLRSKSFRQSGDDYVIVSYFPATGIAPQNSYFLVRVSQTHLTTPVRTPVARIMLWQGNGDTEHQSGLTSVVSTVPNGFSCALTKVTTTEAGGGTFTQDTGLDIVAIAFNGATGAPKEATDMLLVPGGSLLAFDGTNYCEDGHPIYPDAPTTPGVETAGGLSAGLYSWRCVYRYTDANGRINRSKPGLVLQHTISAGSKRIDLQMPTARITGRPGASVVIELERGVVNDNSVYRLVASMANDPTVDVVTFPDGVSDATLQLGEPLYTTGGVLGNDPTPGTRCVIFHRDRVWYLSDDDRKKLGFSDVAQTFLGWQFSEDRTIRIDDEYGDMTALAGLGQGVVAFKNEAIYVINGDGPNSLGQLSFNDPARVEEGIGCIEPRSVVTAPPGVFFQSERGIYLYTGSGPAEYVGRPVDRYNFGLTIVAAIHVAKKSQVRFYTLTGGALVYDYLHQQWSVDVFAGGLVIAGAAVWNGLPAFSALAGVVLAEDSTGTVYTDNGLNFTRRESSPWLSIGDLAGVERFYEIQGIGDASDVHTLSAQIQYDTAIGPLSTPQTKAFGIGESWEWRLRPARQLATSIKITLTETGPTAGYSAVALAIILGVEPAHLKRFQQQAKSLL